GRFFIEMLRTDPATTVFGDIRINVVVSAVAFVTAAILFWATRNRRRENPEYVRGNAERSTEAESKLAPITPYVAGVGCSWLFWGAVSRRTKIVCTRGRAVAEKASIRALTDAGMNVARLNFSHAEHAEHQQNYQWVRDASAETGKPVGML